MWFDRFAMTKVAHESRDTLKTAYEYVNDIIKSENDNGIPTNRIVVGKHRKCCCCCISNGLDDGHILEASQSKHMHVLYEAQKVCICAMLHRCSFVFA